MSCVKSERKEGPFEYIKEENNKKRQVKPKM